MTDLIAKKLIKTDKNGTQYFWSNTCPKCGGTGTLTCYEYIEKGRCFKCDGTGIFEHTWKEYTPEYAKILTDRRIAKHRKGAEERNKKFMLSEGFNEEGFTWIVPGNTYSIKDALKEAGAKFSPLLGWHFNAENPNYPNLIKVSFNDLTSEDVYGTRSYDNAVSKINELQEQYRLSQLTSEWYGAIGDKIALTLTVVSIGHYTTHITYHGEDHWVYTFADADGNKFVWNTSSYLDVTEGDSCTVKGTIKNHSEYKSEKQTELTRCKVDKTEDLADAG